MKKYFNEGLLPDEYVEEGFRRLLEIRKGTIGEAFRKVAREMSVEYQENYYDYIYELEGYINEVLRERTSLDMTMAEVISKAVETYLMDVFYDNTYTYLENYLEKMFLAQGYSQKEVDSMNMSTLFDLVDNRTTLFHIKKTAKRRWKDRFYSGF